MDHLKLVSGCLAIIFLIGCSHGSNGIKTYEMTADLQVVALESGITQISAALERGQPLIGKKYIKLENADAFLAKSTDFRDPEYAHTKQIELDEISGFLRKVEYTGELDVGFEEGKEFEIELTRLRPRGYREIISTAQLPAPFTLDAPSQNDTFSYDDDITVTWSWVPERSHRGNIIIFARGTCGDSSYKMTIPTERHSGRQVSVTIAANQLIPPSVAEARNEPCDTVIEVTNNRKGIVSNRFNGGEFIAKQLRSVNVTIRPHFEKHDFHAPSL